MAKWEVLARELVCFLLFFYQAIAMHKLLYFLFNLGCQKAEAKFSSQEQ